MKLIIFIELLGVIAFAYSGAISAMHKRLDIFGVLIVSFVTAIGGGTIRDMLIGSFPVAWIQDLRLILTIIVTYIISLLYHPRIRTFRRAMFWFDTIGLAVFATLAIYKGIDFNLHPLVCIALGTITGCFGGIIRDVLLNEVPYVFRQDIYASACIAGGIVYFIVQYSGASERMCGLIAGGTIVLIRIGANYLKWRLPLIYIKEKKK